MSRKFAMPSKQGRSKHGDVGGAKSSVISLVYLASMTFIGK